MATMTSMRRVAAVGMLMFTSAVCRADSGTTWAQIKALDQTYKTNMQSLDAQIAPFRQQIQTAQASITPLQAQKDTLRSQYEDQRAALTEQVQPGYLAAYNQEKQDLASAKSSCQASRENTQQQCSSQEKQIRDQFKTTTQGLRKS